MTRQAARKAEDATAESGVSPAVGGGKDALAARPLDPLVTALSRAVDRLEGTAG